MTGNVPRISDVAKGFEKVDERLDAHDTAIGLANAAAVAATAAAEAATDAAEAATAATAGKVDKTAVISDPAQASLKTTDAGAGAVPTSVPAKLADYRVDAGEYMTGSGDEAAGLQLAMNQAILSGRELHLPRRTLRVDSSIIVTLDQYLAYKSAFSKGLIIRGDLNGRTVVDSRVANGYTFDIGTGYDHALGFKAVLGGRMEGFTIRNGAATAVSSAIRARSIFQWVFEGMHVQGMSADAFKLLCSEGDRDASNQVTFRDVRVEDCARWAFDLGTDPDHNETGGISLVDTFVQGCGTAPQKTITGISNAAAGVVTAANHGFTNGQKVFIALVTGMTGINSYVTGRSYTVSGVTTNTFAIDLNTTGLGAWVSGGIVFPSVATSGHVRLKNQIVHFDRFFSTISKGRTIYVDGLGGGLPQDITFNASTIENPQLIGLHVAGGRSINATGLHIYSNSTQAAAPCIWGHLYDGETAVVSDIDMRGICVRTTDAAGEADFTAFQTIGANAYVDTIRVDPRIHVKQFGYNAQRMFRNIRFDPVPSQCTLVAFNATEARLRPDTTFGRGDVMPLRVSYGGSAGAQYGSGMVIPCHIPLTGVSISNAGLAANTTYYGYLYAANGILNTPTLELSATAPVLDAEIGYMVKTGDPTRIALVDWQGLPQRVRTDVSSQFITTGGEFLHSLILGGAQAGTFAHLWVSNTDRKIHYKAAASLPASLAGSDFTYWPGFETSVAYDPPSLVAGAETTVDVAVVCSAFDFCRSVGFSTGFGGLVAYGVVKATNTVTVYIKNPTAGTIDLAAGTLRVVVERR